MDNFVDFQPDFSYGGDFLCQLFNLVLDAKTLSGFTFRGVFLFNSSFGMLFGVLILNEHVEISFIVGTCMVMLGVILVSLQGWLKKPEPQIKTQTSI